MWHKLIIGHSQKNYLGLYCKEIDKVEGVAVADIFAKQFIFKGKVVEVAITEIIKGKERVLYRELSSGSIKQLYLDQYKNKITWTLEKRNLDRLPCENNWIPNKVEQRFIFEIGDPSGLVSTIATAINETFTNRGFSRYVKKCIIGTWSNKDVTVSFYENNTFEISGKAFPGSILGNAPKKGNWGISANMLYMLDEKRSGIRTQVIDIKNNVMFLPGCSRAIFYTLKKQLPKK